MDNTRPEGLEALKQAAEKIMEDAILEGKDEVEVPHWIVELARQLGIPIPDDSTH
jgi:hypothetical protein